MQHGIDKRLWLRLRRAAEEEMGALLKALPRPLRDRVTHIPVIFQPAPGRAMVRDGVDPELLGLFVGNAVDESSEQPTPTEIYIFLDNLWEDAQHDTAEYRVQVRQTLLHEIGHYLGLDEDALIERDME